MKARRFDIFHLSLEDIHVLRALKAGEKSNQFDVVFTYDDSRKFTAIRKRNTQLFDALYEIARKRGREREYSADEKVITDYMYDAIVVEMRKKQKITYAMCVAEEQGKKVFRQKRIDELPGLLNDKGFVIQGVPWGQFTPDENDREGRKKDIEYVPFISSASMSRNSEYLFVAKHLARPLMERLTLHMLTMDEKGRPKAGPVLTDGGKNHRFLSPAKLSAYVGLSLSDGSSVREMQTAFGDGAPKVELNANTVVCVEDLKNFPLQTADVSPLVWMMHPVPDQRQVLNKQILKPAAPLGLRMLLTAMCQSKNAAKKLMKAVSAQATEEWNTVIKSVTLEKLSAWADALDGVSIPLCLPGFPDTREKLEQFAFLSLFGQNWTPENKEPQRFDLGQEELDEKKKAFCEQVNSFAEAGASNFKAYFGDCKIKRLPKKTGGDARERFRVCTLENKGGLVRLTVGISGNTALLNSEEAFLSAPLAGIGSDADLLSGFFSRLHPKEHADTQEKQALYEQFVQEFQDHRVELLGQWKTLLLEMAEVPLGLSSSIVPSTDSLGELTEFQPGYAFLYAAVMYIRNQTALNTGDRTIRFYPPGVRTESDAESGQNASANAAAEADDQTDPAEEGVETSPAQENGTGPADISDNGNNDEQTPMAWPDLRDKLIDTLDKLIDEKNAGDYLGTLWNCVFGEEDVVTTGKKKIEAGEETGESEEVSYCFLQLESRKSQRFMARLTHVYPKDLHLALCAFFDKMPENGQENKNQTDPAQIAWEQADVQYQYWLQQEHQPEKSPEWMLHQACRIIKNEVGMEKLTAEALDFTNWECISEEQRQILTAVKWKLRKTAFFEDTAALSDGCGFADDEVFRPLNELMLGRKLKAGEELPYNALIIRMPFLKGLLIRLEWQGILKEYAGIPLDAPNPQIKDVFRSSRPLNDAHVMITESMFKGLKQLKHFDPAQGRALLGLPETEALSAWDYYWRMAEQYEISLLVTGRNSPPAQTTSLNYQFLATQQIDLETLKTLTKRNLQDVSGLYDPEKLAEWLKKSEKNQTQTMENQPQSDLEDPDTPPDPAGDGAGPATEPNGQQPNEDALEQSAEEDEAQQVNETRVQQQLCAKLGDPFIRTRYMRNAIYARLHSLVLDMMRGKIPEIMGDVRFIVPDLDAMLRAASGLVRETEKEITKAALKTDVSSPLQTLGDRGMGRYYAPYPEEHKKTWSKEKNGETKGRPAAILRNPHLAIGEDAVLLPLEEEDKQHYDEKFGHLTGVAMVNGLTFYTINGADSDGDRASVVTQPEVIEAIGKTAEQVNDTLRLLIDHKKTFQEYLTFAGDSKVVGVHDEGMNELVLFLRMLVDALPDTLPKTVKNNTVTTRSHVCPPLIYGGSGAGGTMYTVQEARYDTVLKEAFWKTYLLTTQQMIGQMSLNALDAAAAVYATLHEPKLDTVQKLLRQLLALFRMSNGALQTALEIDMAKTSLKPRSVPLQFSNENSEKGILGDKSVPHGRSDFREYRNEFEKRKRTLNQERDPIKFLKALSEMVNTLSRESDDLINRHPLNSLPKLVLAQWEAEEKQLLTTARNETDQMKEENISFDRLFQKPQGTDPKRVNDAKKEIRKYGKRIKERHLFADRRNELAKSYQACLNHVMQRMTLEDAAKRIDDLLLPAKAAAFAAGRKETGANIWLCRALGIGQKTAKSLEKLTKLDAKLREDPILARFVWEKNPEQLKKHVKELLLSRHSVPLKQMKNKKQIRFKLKRANYVSEFVMNDSTDIYLFKQYVKYLRQSLYCEITTDAAMEGIHTPAALRAELLKENTQDARNTVISACLELLKNGGMENGTKVMSEFLMVHLLGEYLMDYISTNRSPDPSGQQQAKPQRQTASNKQKGVSRE